ncbi:MAG TPA: hypothetical protein VFQ35_13990 [Polyangiaceae bacterium]|nr:hypothetical protein [Polyangiaceae bacterium]
MTDLSPEARRILDLTREARTPSIDDKLRVARLLSRSVELTALSVASQASGAAAAKPTLFALSVKWLAGVVPIVVLAAAGYSYWPRPEPSVSAVDRVVVAPPAQPPTVLESPASAVPAEATSVIAPVATVGSPPAARSDQKSRRPNREDTLNEELDLLHDAQAAWRSGDATRALSLIAQHRKRFPKSALAPERDALSVLSLCASGRTAEAKAAAQRAFRKGERSPLHAAVERSCIKD